LTIETHKEMKKFESSKLCSSVYQFLRKKRENQHDNHHNKS